MPLLITDEEYGGLPSLHANAGDWKACELTFVSRFDYESTELEKVTYREVAGTYYLELPTGSNWGDYGFASNQNLEITTTWYYRGSFMGAPGANFATPQTWNVTIDYISGNQLFISGPLDTVPDAGVAPFTSHILNGSAIPFRDDPNNQLDPLVLVVTDAPEEIEFLFNLTPNGSTSMNSVIDGELMRFSNTSVASMVPSGSVNLSQSGNQSGGYVKNVVLTYVGIDGNNYRTYRVNYELIQWGFIQDGFSEPQYYNAADNIAPIANVKLFAVSGNPNTVLEAKSQNTEADTGGFNENYNGGTNLYTLQSVTWTDSLSNPIDAMDYSGPSDFEATITAPGQSIVSSTFRLGMVFRPLDQTLYQNKLTSLVNNLLVNAPDLDFMHSGSVDATVRPGFPNEDGVQFDLSNIQFFINGGTLTVRGRVTPNAAAVDFFNNIPDGGKKMTLWASIGDHTVDDTNVSRRVNLKLHDEDVIDAPVLGVQIPDMVGTVMFDHANIDSSGSNPAVESTITTEDDVLYEATLRLVTGKPYESMKLTLEAYNTVTEEAFPLEQYNFSFANVPYINGEHQPNFNIGRGFNLPPASNKNHVILKREPSLDIVGKYGIRVCYGFLARWEYWLAQTGVSNDFYDVNQPNNGQNKNWEHYADAANWVMRVKLNTIQNGVENFDYHTFDIRPYQDENATTAVTITRVSDGATLSAFENNEVHDVEAVITWNSGAFTAPWAAATIEDYEGGNRWLISSVLDHGIAQNPLSPIPGQTKLQLTFAADEATLRFRVDTNKVSADQVSLTYRIYDPSGAIEGKLTTDDIQKVTTDDDVKIKA